MHQSKNGFRLIVVVTLLGMIFLSACNLPVKLPEGIGQNSTDTSEPPPDDQEVIKPKPETQEENKFEIGRAHV